MPDITDAELRIPEDFIARKKAAAMSNSELARRADRSLNTVKAYMQGKQVRDTTIQRIHEALNEYIAEQSKKYDQKAGLEQLLGDSRTANDLLSNAADFHHQFLNQLSEAAKLASTTNERLDPKTVNEIEVSRAQSNGLITLIKDLAA